METIICSGLRVERKKCDAHLERVSWDRIGWYLWALRPPNLWVLLFVVYEMNVAEIGEARIIL